MAGATFTVESYHDQTKILSTRCVPNSSSVLGQLDLGAIACFVSKDSALHALGA